ncbi:hypothetical protein [Saccharopolyspora tripterygii]
MKAPTTMGRTSERIIAFLPIRLTQFDFWIRLTRNRAIQCLPAEAAMRIFVTGASPESVRGAEPLRAATEFIPQKGDFRAL